GALANVLGEPLHVGIQRAVAGAMLEDHGVAVAAVGAGQDDLAIAGGLDGRAAWRGVVDALVRADLVQDRVAAALGEARADAREVHGGADERLADIVAFGGVVACLALAGGVADGGVGVAAVD